jgi:uridine kinase
MTDPGIFDPQAFSARLYEKLQAIHPGIEDLALYEFRYALRELTPELGWASVRLWEAAELERLVNRLDFYQGIQLKPREGERIVLDSQIVQLNQVLFAGLVSGAYSPEWVMEHFYFDIRGFYFLHRTRYFTDAVLAHFGGQPYRQFEPKQAAFARCQDVGYKAFQAANAEVDRCFIQSVQQLIAARGTPVLLAIAGQTAAGKTEIVDRLREAFEQQGRKVASIELDNFLTDRDEREARGIHTEGKQALHFELFRQCLADILQGKRISTPRYDFVHATSSHALDGSLKPGGVPVEIEPADIIFMEGNFPFLLEEVAHLIGIKVVYLTDDPVRLLRKWKRDVDYRKKYEPTYFRNRYFRDQFIMAQVAYLPQLELCDLCLDTTGGALWTTPDIAAILRRGGEEA